MLLAVVAWLFKHVSLALTGFLYLSSFFPFFVFAKMIYLFMFSFVLLTLRHMRRWDQ